MGIKLRNSDISKAYLGSNEVQKIYLGTNEVYSAIPVSNDWTPANIATTLWLDASDLSTITESGGFVSEWRDKSTNGYNYTQVLGANQPFTNNRTINGLNVIDFDGTNSFMQLASGFQAETNAMLFIIVNSDTVDGVKRVFNNQVGAGTRFAIYEDNVFLSSIKFPSFNILSIARNTGEKLIGLYDDGNALGLGYDASYTENDSDDGDVANLDKWFLGCYNGSSEFFDGAIAEIVYVKSYDLDTRQKTEGYLAWKWGLQANLPVDHPYKLSAPTV